MTALYIHMYIPTRPHTLLTLRSPSFPDFPPLFPRFWSMNGNGFAIAAMLEYKIHGRFLDTATRCLYDPFIKANEHRFKLMAMFCSLDRGFSD